MSSLLGSFVGAFAAAAQSQPQQERVDAEAVPVNTTAQTPVAKAVPA